MALPRYQTIYSKLCEEGMGADMLTQSLYQEWEDRRHRDLLLGAAASYQQRVRINAAKGFAYHDEPEPRYDSQQPSERPNDDGNAGDEDNNANQNRDANRTGDVNQDGDANQNGDSNQDGDANQNDGDANDIPDDAPWWYNTAYGEQLWLDPIEPEIFSEKMPYYEREVSPGPFPAPLPDDIQALAQIINALPKNPRGGSSGRGMYPSRSALKNAVGLRGEVSRKTGVLRIEVRGSKLRKYYGDTRLFSLGLWVYLTEEYPDGVKVREQGGGQKRKANDGDEAPKKCKKKVADNGDNLGEIVTAGKNREGDEEDDEGDMPLAQRRKAKQKETHDGDKAPKKRKKKTDGEGNPTVSVKAVDLREVINDGGKKGDNRIDSGADVTETQMENEKDMRSGKEVIVIDG